MRRLTTIAVLLALGLTAHSQDSLPNKNGQAYNPDGIEMVYVEGSGSGIRAKKGFYIGKYEITQDEWESVMGLRNPSEFEGKQNPVEKVSWNDVQVFLKKLNELTGRNYRLPTEVEWMYAANGGSNGDTYEYAGSNNIDEVAWYDGNSGSRTHPVGTKKPNSLGIYDMSGNVREWCSDCANIDESDVGCFIRVERGGSWEMGAQDCRSAHRSWSSPGGNWGDHGFRIVLP